MQGKPAESHHRTEEGKPPIRRCCVLLLHIEKHLVRDKVAALIGVGGINTATSWTMTKTKVRIRGRGSMHKEEAHGKEGRNDLLWTGEANVPLQMALSAEGPRRLQEALVMARSLLDHYDVRYEVCDVRGPEFEMDRLMAMCVFGMVPPEWKPVIHPASPGVALPSCGAGPCHGEAAASGYVHMPLQYGHPTQQQPVHHPWCWKMQPLPDAQHSNQLNQLSQWHAEELAWHQQWVSHEEEWACSEAHQADSTNAETVTELLVSDAIQRAVGAYLACNGDEDEEAW